MGNWNITIQGIGSHHNHPQPENDANKMAADFVEKLRSVGHVINSATFTHGGMENLDKTSEVAI